MPRLAQFWQRWLNLTATLSKIEFSAVGKKLFCWKLKTQLKISENPTEYIEALLYLELRFITALFASPLRMTFLPRRANERWRKPWLRAREGFPLCSAIGIQVLLVIREIFGLSIVYNLLAVKKGMLTPDTLLFIVVFPMLVGGHVGTIAFIVRRREVAQMFNSSAIFYESYARKYHVVAINSYKFSILARIP